MNRELELYRQSFGADRDFEKLLFKNSPVTLKIDGVTVSQLFLLPCIIKSGEDSFSAYYIFAACTDGNFRKRGYMEKLLKRVIAENHIPLILRPATEKLTKYYEKFGFKSFTAVDSENFGLSLEPIDSFLELTLNEDKTKEGEFTLMALNSPLDLDKIYFPFSLP